MEETVTRNVQDGTQHYQKKIVEEGPGYLHIQVISGDGMPSPDGGGAPGFSSGPQNPDGFISMMQQVMQVIQQQRIANAMNQMLSQGLIFIPEPFLEYVDEDNNTISEEVDNNNRAIMPY